MYTGLNMGMFSPGDVGKAFPAIEEGPPTAFVPAVLPWEGNLPPCKFSVVQMSN